MNNTAEEVLSIAKELIARPSVTPADHGCQEFMADYLSKLGFDIEPMIFEDTTNLWARKGDSEQLFCFAGHTDVVPAGNTKLWHSNPFEPVVREGHLFGRGAADMKGSLAAMLVATKNFVNKHPDHAGSIAFLITSDEEGPFINGTVRVIDTLEQRQEKIKWAIVGEPSSKQQLGDVIKHGRRGSLTGYVTVTGKQGHVAYPHLASNPIHLMTSALNALVQTKWDQGNAHFPPTSFQIVDIKAGEQATNVIPSQATFCFNFRYSNEVIADQLKLRVETLLKEHHVPFDISWSLSGEPFITSSGTLVEESLNAVYEKTGMKPRLETTGGTSDGRFIAPTGAEVIELGPINATIHQVNECVRVEDLTTLTHCYEGILEKLLCRSNNSALNKS